MTTARFSGTVEDSVTHVMAVSTIDGDIKRVLAATEGGAFAIEVEPERPWILVFVDARQAGSAMVKGTLRAASLDAFLPRTAGEIDLGAVSFHGREALMTASHAELDAALGWSSNTQSMLGDVDDLATRYASPDVDGDGVLDPAQGRFAALEFHAEYRMHVDGRDATAGDLMAPEGVELAHAGTGIYVRVPTSFGKVDREDVDVTFDQAFHGTALGPHTPTAPSGTPITDVTFGDAYTFGVFASPGHELPRGDYAFRTGEHTLAFTLVAPPLAGEMTTGRFQVMPSVRLVPRDASCKAACSLREVQFAWQRRTADGWAQIDDEAAAALRPVGALDLVDNHGGAVRFEFPVGVSAGAMPWELIIARTTVPAPTRTMTTSNIKFAKLSFQTRPGLMMFATLGK